MISFKYNTTGKCISINEMIELIDRLNKLGYYCHTESFVDWALAVRDWDFPLNHYFLEDSSVHVHLTAKFFNNEKQRFYIYEYSCRKDTEENVVEHYIAPSFVSAQIRGNWQIKLHETCEYDKAEMTSAGELYVNPKFEGQRVKAIGYDLNSAYGYFAREPIPDTANPLGQGFLSDNQVGFLHEDIYLVAVFKKGEYCHERYNLIESPYIRYMNTMYERRSKYKKGSFEREKYKCMINYAVGLIQKINPQIRACIIGRCNEYIKYFIDKYKDIIVMSNTDSIVSIEPIEEIEAKLGEGLGEWKKEHDEYISIRGRNQYRWDSDQVRFSGLPKNWVEQWEKIHGRKWDILLDEMPIGYNLYEYDKTIKNFRRLERNEYY